MRRGILRRAAAALCAVALAGCDGGGGGPLISGGTRFPGGGGGGGGSTTLVPDTSALYTARLVGTTYVGNTAVPGPATVYRAQEDFDVTGVLVLEPALERTGTLANGANLRDVGLFVGQPPSTPAAGSLWLATHTDVFSLARVTTVPAGLSRIDMAFVTGDAPAGTLAIVADGGFYDLAAGAPVLLNSFSTNTGAIAQVYRATGGGMELQFAADGTVSGRVDVVGTNASGVGSGRVVATLTATPR